VSGNTQKIVYLLFSFGSCDIEQFENAQTFFVRKKAWKKSLIISVGNFPGQ
jgi:hypothetical protein